jgi:hypothetical protein
MRSRLLKIVPAVTLSVLPAGANIIPICLRAMRANGVRLLAVSCLTCHHEMVLNADRWPGQIVCHRFGSRMVCTKCGTVGVDVRPNWRERER